nr:neural Wiskott-Aldrich syndrome protein-like [Vulpes vulpes]
MASHAGPAPPPACGAAGPSEPPAPALRLPSASTRCGRRGRAPYPSPLVDPPPRGAAAQRAPQAARPQEPSPLAVSRTLLPEQRRHSLIGQRLRVPSKKRDSDWGFPEASGCMTLPQIECRRRPENPAVFYQVRY